MDDDVQISGDLEMLLAGIESGWEMRRYYERHGRHLETLMVYADRLPVRQEPQMLEDLALDEDELC